MKRTLSILLAVLMVLTIAPLSGIANTDWGELFSVEAGAASSGVLTYDVYDGEVAITDCDESASGELVIPDTIDGYPITSIGYDAFYGCENLTSVVIPNSVTTIGWGAFWACDSLTSIIIPASVTNIDEAAFAYCDNLTVISVDENNSVYDSRNNCNAIIETATNTLISACKNTVIPENVTAIGDSVFRGCENITEMVISDNITSIGDYAFYNCENLVNIIIPDSVTSIGEAALSCCYNLASVTMSKNIKSISKYTFNSCSKLTNVDIPDGVTSIGENAFSDCSSLADIIIPDSVKSIGYCAFYNCENLVNIIIPDSVTSIGEEAFGQTGLVSVTIPDSVTIIGSNIFSYCENLESISVDKNNSVYDSRNNCNAIIETATNTLICSCKNTAIPDTVTAIGDYAFAGSTFKSIVIPDSVTSIGDFAFAECLKLTGITIPESVVSIGDYAFEGSAVISINIPDGITEISEGMFYNCASLENITIPASVTTVGDQAFYYCQILVNINVDDNNPIYDSRNNCNAIIETATNTLVFGCLGTVIPDTVTTIGDYAFRGCYLPSITIPGSITKIGKRAFDCILVSVIYYGTAEQFAAIDIDDGNEHLTDEDETIHFYITSSEAVIPDNLVKLTTEPSTEYPWIFIMESELKFYSFKYDPDTNTVYLFACNNDEYPIIAFDADSREIDEEYSSSTDDEISAFPYFINPAVPDVEAKTVYKNNAKCTDWHIADEYADNYADEEGYEDGVYYCQKSTFKVYETDSGNYLYVDWYYCEGDESESQVFGDYIGSDRYNLIFGSTSGNAEISRETKTVDKIAHTPAAAVKENEVAATCTKAGSYDEVVYCSVCNTEISRETKTVDKIAHTPAAAVKENEKAATCTKDGSYDSVVYCSVCNTEISRESKTITALGHDWGDWTVTTPATIKSEGVETRYCANCDATETRAIAKLTVTETIGTTNEDGNDANISFAEDAFPGVDSEDISVSVDKVDSSIYITYVSDTTCAYDITIYNNGKEVEPSAPVLVCLPVPANITNVKGARVWHIDSATGKAEEIKDVTYNEENNSICFYADSFSVYVLKVDGDVAETPADDTTTCSHNCHKSGILGFFWKIQCFFYKIFGVSKYRTCECGAAHW